MKSIDDRKARSEKTFDRLSETYFKSYFGRHARSLYTHVLSRVDKLDFDSVLDVGCGTGDLLRELTRQRHLKHAAGVDISTQMLEKARGNLGDTCELVRADSEALPFADAAFELVVCTDSFHHYPNPVTVLGEFKRVLKPTGIIIISEIWLPFPLRQLTNLVLPFCKSGDVHVYARAELADLMGVTGLTMYEWNLLHPMAFFSVSGITDNLGSVMTMTD